LDPSKLKNLRLVYKEDCLHGELTDRYALQRVNPESFSTILILADESDAVSAMTDADSRALATLLLVRDIQSQHSRAEHGSLSPELIQRASSEALPWYHKLKVCRTYRILLHYRVCMSTCESACLCVCVNVCVLLSVCDCVCVCERGRECVCLRKRECVCCLIYIVNLQ
jgi:hypothetical protein